MPGATRFPASFDDVPERVAEPRMALRRYPPQPCSCGFRANNALNHVQITSFGTTVNSSTYGLATGAIATRSVTLNLRFNF